MTRLKTIADETWRTGEVERGLRDVIARIGLDLASELFTLLCGGVRTDEHAVAAALAHGFYNELVEIGECVASFILLSHEKGLDVGQNRILIEVVANDARDVS